MPDKNTPLLRQQCLINGQWLISDTTFPVHNPANGELIAHVPKLGESATQSAIDAANAALPAWRAKSGKERSQILRRWFELIMQHQEDLAQLMTAEQGKPLTESRGEIAYAASFIEWFGEEAKRIYGDVMSHPNAGQRIMTLKQPIGVCAAITPWNFPAAMITRKVGPALAAGCTIIVKPASQTPLTALALGELAQQAGIPAGVLNIITGSGREIGDVLAASPIVRKISFTGSTETGRALMAACAPTIKKLSLELGGNAPFIVFADADLDAAVAGAIASKFRNAGQTCVCANRFLIASEVYDEFATKFTKAIGNLNVGYGDQSHTQIGPLIDTQAIEKVEAHIADALARGAHIRLGGARHALGGTFFTPTLLTEVPPAALINHEETFGPVAALVRFEHEAEAIALANNTEYGLAAYLYTRDLARTFRVAEAIEAGMVGINTGLISNEVAPFGGIKQSGMGREGSKYGIEEYSTLKYLCL
ncbi:NAD-dependent succinate-semialdehyde dehydrogenase [Chitinibacter bivalviorum]|uniref:NAD-dependent succinate-semialdehyde dehydrogenase n=1 Tax=Chitinibacter bivalviorum TaxID=2739434 RepID=A0A7H9BJJ6_9NEIS|nr:NAD-dependent succinate-semialdehyde dehydrogenase [Chitinibacter bivalviorum]QLG88639.1 NAD-dependent succinate-semialdehyde dehydrogenase [Chitinibacter bivalviorum]